MSKVVFDLRDPNAAIREITRFLNTLRRRRAVESRLSRQVADHTPRRVAARTRKRTAPATT